MLEKLKETMHFVMHEMGIQNGGADHLQQVDDMERAKKQFIEQPYDALYDQKIEIITDFIDGIDNCKNRNDKVKSEQDNINHPKHYNNGKMGIETIDMIKNSVPDFGSYLLGNVFKYVSRFEYKNGLEDLKKAQWYLNKLIEEKNSQGIDNHSESENVSPEPNMKLSEINLDIYEAELDRFKKELAQVLSSNKIDEEDLQEDYLRHYADRLMNEKTEPDFYVKSIPVFVDKSIYPCVLVVPHQFFGENDYRRVYYGGYDSVEVDEKNYPFYNHFQKLEEATVFHRENHNENLKFFEKIMNANPDIQIRSYADEKAIINNKTEFEK